MVVERTSLLFTTPGFACRKLGMKAKSINAGKRSIDLLTELPVGIAVPGESDCGNCFDDQRDIKA